MEPTAQPRFSTWSRSALVCVLVLASALRLVRVPLRWDEWTWHYLSYDAHTWEALREHRAWEALTTFSGLHPPLYPLLHSFQELVLPIPGLVLLASACFSLAAVALVLRLDPLAGLLLATSPVQVAYAAEANNYPMMCFVVAAVWWSRERVSAGAPIHWLGVVGVVAVWTHLLAGWVAFLAALTLPRKKTVSIGIWMVIGSLPLLLPTWDLVTEPGTWRQPPVRPLLMATTFLERFGPWPLLLAPLAWRGAKKRRDLALGFVGTLVFLWVLQGLGAAAPHQFPYYLAAGIPGALLVAAGSDTQGRFRVALGVAALQALVVGAQNTRGWIGIQDDAPRALDRALTEAQDGDGIYLLSPPLVEDDDKSARSAVLRRISPWQALPAAAPYAFDLLDHRHGQPRRLGDRTIYVNDHPRAEIDEAAKAHNTLFLVVYDHQNDPRFSTELRQRFGQDPESIGPDLLWRLSFP